MKTAALTVTPGADGSARLETIEVPGPTDGVLIEMIAVGVCGTDREIVSGHYGSPPPGQDRMILGHESLARVVETPSNAVVESGDLVVAVVRHPDPVPCLNCAAGEWDMCRNGGFTEHGIKSLDGFMAERVRVATRCLMPVPDRLGELGVLVEPASVLAKAWEHIELIGSRSRWQPERVLVTGAGPIGLLAALMACQRDLKVTVFDRVDSGPKPALVEDLGATYQIGELPAVAQRADVILECTGASSLLFEVMGNTARNGIVCLTGVTSPGRPMEVPVERLSRELVLENDVVFGSVNANRMHYEKAIDALTDADPTWLERLITRRVALARWADALEPHDNDVKVVLVP